MLSICISMLYLNQSSPNAVEPAVYLELATATTYAPPVVQLPCKRDQPVAEAGDHAVLERSPVEAEGGRSTPARAVSWAGPVERARKRSRLPVICRARAAGRCASDRRRERRGCASRAIPRVLLRLSIHRHRDTPGKPVNPPAARRVGKNRTRNYRPRRPSGQYKVQ